MIFIMCVRNKTNKLPVLLNSPFKFNIYKIHNSDVSMSTYECKVSLLKLIGTNFFLLMYLSV